MKELFIFLSLISLLSISSALPHFTFSGIESFHDCSGEKGKISLYIIGSLSEEVGSVTLPNYNIEKMGDFQCALSKNEGEKDPARSHVITCTIEGDFEPKAFILDEPKVNGFDFLNEKGESTWPTNPEKATFLIGECGEKVELDKETLFFQNSEKSGLFRSGSYEDPVKTIRKDVVDKALMALPARNMTTKEIMMERMKSVKTIYSLSDIEAAYMVYKWEYENLAYDCYNYNHDRNKICFREDCTYSSGVGVCDGFARIYAAFCNAMGVEAYRVVGYSKAGDFQPGNRPKSSDHAWNAIVIDGNYYLLDVTWGIGTCEGETYVQILRDSYFCTKPEAFIRTHLPANIKFQLVYPTITLDEWSNMLEISLDFYESGMTEVKPDLAILEINTGKIEVEIAYEPSDEPKAFLYRLFHLQGNTYMEQENTCWINNAKTRAVMTCNAKYKGNYKLQIFGGLPGKGSYPHLLEYDIHSTKNNPDLLGFPKVYGMFAESFSELIEPLYDPLPKGEYVNFKMRTTTFDSLSVETSGGLVDLKNDGNGLFTGRIKVVGDIVSLVGCFGKQCAYLLDYSTKLSKNVDDKPENVDDKPGYPKSFHALPHVLYSPKENPLIIGKSYRFNLECEKCKKLSVLLYTLDSQYNSVSLFKLGNRYTRTIKIKDNIEKIQIVDLENDNSATLFYQYEVSY